MLSMTIFDDKLLASIHRILRDKGVPVRDLDDHCQKVAVAVTTSSRVPAEEPHRSKYIHTIARNVGRKYREQRLERKEVLAFDEDAAPPAAEAVPYDAVDLARRLHASAVAQDPQGVDWLMRAKVYGESETLIASRDGVPVNRVRQRIHRLVARMRANSQSISVLASVLVLATFIGYWAIRKNGVKIGPDEVASPPPRELAPPQPAPNDESSAGLRRLALASCKNGEWADCLMRLDRAKEIDPAGDTAPEVQEARSSALSKVKRNAGPEK